MKKAEAETALRGLAHTWREEKGYPLPGTTEFPGFHYSFSAFESWLSEKHYSHYLDFRSTGGARDCAERWFDQEMQQAWRN